jgi:hypothetical protein
MDAGSKFRIQDFCVHLHREALAILMFAEPVECLFKTSDDSGLCALARPIYEYGLKPEGIEVRMSHTSSERLLKLPNTSSPAV